MECEVLPGPTLAYRGMASGGREGLRSARTRLAKVAGGACEVDSKGIYRAPWENTTMVVIAIYSNRLYV